MSWKRLTALATTTVLAGATLIAAAPAQAESRTGTRSLASVLGADGHHFDGRWGDFDIVDKAVRTVLRAKPASAVGVLADGSVALTGFLPTDQAFRRLDTDLTGVRRHTERGVWRSLAGLVDVDTLESVLLYHVVPGATITYRQARAADGAKLTTALGSPITVKVTKRHNVFLRDADRNDLDPRVLPRWKNINHANTQIAHGINRVLRPVDL